MHEQLNIKSESNMHKYIYRDALKDEVVFECTAKDIEDADKQYLEMIGENPCKQNHIGCSVELIVNEISGDVKNMSEKSPKKSELFELNKIKKISKERSLFRSMIKGFEESDARLEKEESEKKRRENIDEILGRKKSPGE